MTQNEADLILIESLLHTPNSRAEFLKNKAKEKSYSLKVFYEELKDSFERIEKYVNTKDYICWECEEDGSKTYSKKSINLFSFTNGQMTGQINSKNVCELGIGLVPIAKEVFGQIASEKLERFEKTWLDIIEKKQKEIESLPQQLQTNLTTNQRAKLFDKLVNGGFIPDENKDCFYWALGVNDEEKPEQPDKWQPIKWNSSKEAFVELFQPILKVISGNEKTISREHKRIIKILFCDKNGDPMDKLRNPKPNRELEIEGILRTISIITEQSFKHKPIR